MSEENYYDILGIDKHATSEEIKKSYRRLSLKYHPDRNEDKHFAEDKFKTISNAYSVLSDKEKKKTYDLNNNNNNNNEYEIENIINILKNNKNMLLGLNLLNKNINNKPLPIIKNLSISLEEAYTGCKKPIEIERWINENSIKCKEKETLYVTIYQGIDNNELIILRNKGNILDENNIGDIKIFIKVVNNTCFERKGLDLIYKKNITLKEALCGFKFTLNFLDKKVFNIDNNNGNTIASGSKKIIKNYGMKRDEIYGNLIIQFNVLFPEKINQEIIEKLKNII